MNIDKDAFSSGQIGSKIWLCEQLEKLDYDFDSINIYAGWYGLTAFLLLSRNKINVGKITSYDIDPECESRANMLNEFWVWQDWKFIAKTRDCNVKFDSAPDLIINTSTEHFDSMEWWKNIHKGTMVALQGNNMAHEDHVYNFPDLKSFTKTFKCSRTLFAGSLDFNYPDWSFTRFMIIGIK